MTNIKAIDIKSGDHIKFGRRTGIVHSADLTNTGTAVDIWIIADKSNHLLAFRYGSQVEFEMVGA